MKTLLVALVAITLSVSAHAKTPLKVFILAGQSNMQGHADVSTFDHMANKPKTAPFLKDIRNDDGSFVVSDKVWITSIGSGEKEKLGKLSVGYGANDKKIGPELLFGIHMQRHLNEPILIIKTAWGGRSLHTDFRPPSAGPYVFTEQQRKHFEDRGKNLDEEKKKKAENTGRSYKAMMAHVQSVLKDITRVYPDYDKKAGYSLEGFVWFQGWNDMVDRGTYPQRDNPGGYKAYSENLAVFIRDVRKELSAPEMPFVIGVLGVGGPTSKYGKQQQRYKAIHQNFRDAMAAPASLPEFKGNVHVVLTEAFWDHELDALDSRKERVRQKDHELKKNPDISKEERARIIKEMRDNLYTDEERKTLRGISNGAYHYLGSAAIMAQIGKAFADAMVSQP